MEVRDQCHAPFALSQKGAGTHRTRGWVGTGTGLDGCGKSRPQLEFELRTVQPLASRYTDYAVSAHALITNNVDFLMVDMSKHRMLWTVS
jgi:hypothetical protein